MKKTIKYMTVLCLTIILLSIFSALALADSSQPVVLPETGGIGTTILYVVGGILVLGTLVLLISKKVMGANSEEKEEEEEEEEEEDEE